MEQYFEDVEIGADIPPLTKGPMTTMHLMRWSAAIENWHRIHYDQPFATKHEGLSDVLVNGSWKQHVLAQMLKDFAGPCGWVYGIEFTYRGMATCGATLTAYGSVEGKKDHDAWGVVECSIGIRSDSGDVTTTGSAEVILPRRDGPIVSHPFIDRN